MKKTQCILSLMVVLTLLAGCATAPTALPTVTAATSATSTVEPSATPVPPTPTPTLDPTPSATPTEAPPVFGVDFGVSLTPESIEDVVGVVRPGEKMVGDLAILHQEMFEVLEANGVTADQLPYFQMSSFIPNSNVDRGFFPSEFGGKIQIFDINNERPVRAVLTKLDTGDGYVLTFPVDFNDGSGEINMVDFVIDLELLKELDAKRAASGSGYELIDETFIKDKLIPNLQLDFTPQFFGPFGELKDEYLPYAEILVKADQNTDEDEIFSQIEEGKVFLVVKCNIDY